MDKPDCSNVVLYHFDAPALSVEQGTTLGLTKMLYESIGGHGRIIGLRRRHTSTALAMSCIITQDQTVLTEKEYEIILHGGNVQSKQTIRSLDSPTYHDLATNTDISLKPHAQIWWTDTFSTRRQQIWGKYPNGNCNLIVASSPQNGLPGYLANETGVRGDYAETDGRTEERRVVFSRDSTSPSTVDTESPRGSNGSPRGSPHQVDTSHPAHKRKWQCFYCKKLFVCRSAYDNHERTHTGEKPFQCTVCGRCFGHQGNLKQHLHIHREIKPHVCDICGKGFTRSNRLRDHKRSHVENQPYELLMRTRVQWTAAQKVTAKNHAEHGAVISNGFEETIKSCDENQDTS